jgi:sulfate adenylyltransferase
MNEKVSINLRIDQYLEAEKIENGALHPLSGFMVEAEFNSVVSEMRLTNGEVFSLPVTLDVDEEVIKKIRRSSEVDLCFEGTKIGTLEIGSIFTCEKPAIAKQLFGTDSIQHPGVARFYRMNDWFVGGLNKIDVPTTKNEIWRELTPDETKSHFRENKWKSIVGFQTRNIPHKAHEYLHRVNLEVSDGLFIQPLIGARKKGDFSPEAVMLSYQYLIEKHYPRSRVLLSPVRIPMRYAGPREAIFHAIIRRNFGCTHFIVGRDHAGVGNYYGKYQAQDLVRTVESELGIAIRYMSGPYYCDICKEIVTEKTCFHLDTNPSVINEISGTWLRQALTNELTVDSRLVRKGVVESLRGIKIFLDETDEY